MRSIGLQADRSTGVHTTGRPVVLHCSVTGRPVDTGENSSTHPSPPPLVHSSSPLPPSVARSPPFSHYCEIAPPSIPVVVKSKVPHLVVVRLSPPFPVNTRLKPPRPHRREVRATCRLFRLEFLFFLCLPTPLSSPRSLKAQHRCRDLSESEGRAIAQISANPECRCQDFVNPRPLPRICKLRTPPPPRVCKPNANGLLSLSLANSKFSE
ncbi:hypothetical protein L484_010819 [Morus notabilis]|uniref:Uncharacterized protein n=1 Tax=Morus notabilis TaxID=981085 RepID=W9SGL8_9ROSA|nr:hypothetical protein L484_010819 [Morus notabilis]